MPLMKSTSKGAFSHNVKAEIAAGKPPKQAVAIAYATKRSAEHSSGKSKSSKTEHHSSHSKERSDHYHRVVATKIYKSPTMMTQARSQKLENDEDYGE